MSKFSYDDANAGKADFEWTYNRLDPRAYFDVLGALDYAIPERAAPVFLRVFDAYATAHRHDTLTAIDLGCSYGINAAILKYGRKMSDLCDHYLSFGEDATSRDILEADQREFASDKATPRSARRGPGPGAVRLLLRLLGGHARRRDPKGLEGEGHYLAEFFLSRPKRDAEAQPLCTILPR